MGKCLHKVTHRKTHIHTFTVFVVLAGDTYVVRTHVDGLEDSPFSASQAQAFFYKAQKANELKGCVFVCLTQLSSPISLSLFSLFAIPLNLRPKESFRMSPQPWHLHDTILLLTTIIIIITTMRTGNNNH